MAKQGTMPGSGMTWDIEIPEDRFWKLTYEYPNMSYSGADIKAIVTYRPFRHEVNLNAKPVTQVLADLQTISVSTFREKQPVRALGCIGAKTYTRGPRTIAGSMVFTIFNKDVLYDIMRAQPGDADPNDFAPMEDSLRYVLVDQIPPFDIVIVAANEYGWMSKQVIYGVEIASTGQVMSIEDLFTEKTCQFTALDLTPLIPLNVANSHTEQDRAFSNWSGINQADFKNKDFGSLLSTRFARGILDSTRNPFK